MPAPRLGVSGLGRLGLSLYDVLAERELERMKAAAAAETARQTRFKEGIELGTARRGDAKQQLDEQIAQHNREKDQYAQAHPKLELLSNLDGPGGRPQTQFANPFEGTLVGSPLPQYVTPPNPSYSLEPSTGPDGQREFAAFDKNTGTLNTIPGHAPPVPVAPRDPPETFTMQSAIDADGNPVSVRFGNRSGNATLLPNLAPYVAPRPITVNDKDSLSDYENTKIGNAEMAKWETRLKPNDLLLMNSAPNLSEAIRMAGMSNAGKNFLTGARFFIEAYARDKSGAAISASEWQTFKAEALPLLGDSPDRIATKRRYRDLQEDLLATNSGPAFTNKYGYKYVPHTRATVSMIRGADGTYAPAPAPGTRSAATPAPRAATPTPTPPRPMASHAAGPTPAAPGAIDGHYVRDPATGKLVLQPAR
jgi:hypothetical protein